MKITTAKFGFPLRKNDSEKEGWTALLFSALRPALEPFSILENGAAR
jgi:hypothetical protein